jgi:hypothetical protein
LYKTVTGKPLGKQLLGKVENTDKIKWNLEEWVVKTQE